MQMTSTTPPSRVPPPTPPRKKEETEQFILDVSEEDLSVGLTINTTLPHTRPPVVSAPAEGSIARTRRASAVTQRSTSSSELSEAGFTLSEDVLDDSDGFGSLKVRKQRSRGFLKLSPERLSPRSPRPGTGRKSGEVEQVKLLNWCFDWENKNNQCAIDTDASSVIWNERDTWGLIRGSEFIDDCSFIELTKREGFLVV